MSTIWLLSTDEERWDGYMEYHTREGAIAAAVNELGLEPGQRFWTAQQVEQPIDNLVSHRLVDKVIEMVAEDTCECFDGGIGEDWLALNTEELEALAALFSHALKQFIETHPRHRPTWFLPADVQGHIAPAQEAGEPEAT